MIACERCWAARRIARAKSRQDLLEGLVVALAALLAFLA